MERHAIYYDFLCQLTFASYCMRAHTSTPYTISSNYGIVSNSAGGRDESEMVQKYYNILSHRLFIALAVVAGFFPWSFDIYPFRH